MSKKNPTTGPNSNRHQSSFWQEERDFKYTRVAHDHLRSKIEGIDNISLFLDAAVKAGIAQFEQIYNEGRPFSYDDPHDLNTPVYVERTMCPICQGAKVIDGTLCTACKGFGTLQRATDISKYEEQLQALQHRIEALEPKK